MKTSVKLLFGIYMYETLKKNINCASHNIFKQLLPIYKNNDCYSTHFLDAWSLVHFTNGVFIKSIFPYLTNDDINIIAILFEILENTPTGIKIWKNPQYKGDSALNIISDIIMLNIGARVTDKNPQISENYNRWKLLLGVAGIDIFVLTKLDKLLHPNIPTSN